VWGNVLGGGFPDLPRIREINEKGDSLGLKPLRTLVAVVMSTGDIFISRYNWPPLPPLQAADREKQVFLKMIDGTKRRNIVAPIRISLFDDAEPVLVLRGQISETFDSVGLSEGITLEWDI
jgi:hypothetical protein